MATFIWHLMVASNDYLSVVLGNLESERNNNNILGQITSYIMPVFSKGKAEHMKL